MKASLEIQKALVTTLEGLGLAVYDYLPQKASYPFILIGDDRQRSLEVKNGDYVEVTSTITVFSNYKGNKEVKTILEQIRNCLDLITDTYIVVGSKVTDSFVVYDNKNTVNQGILEVIFKLLK